MAVALARFEVESHKAFPLFTLAEDGKKREQICLATTVRVRYLHSLQDLLVVFSYLGVHCSFDAVTLIPMHVELDKPSTLTITWSAQPSCMET